MDRNIQGLKRSARLRSEGALAQATAALQRMETADQEINWINFQTVAEARVSTAWLYSQEELRFLILRLRSRRAKRQLR